MDILEEKCNYVRTHIDVIDNMLEDIIKRCVENHYKVSYSAPAKTAFKKDTNEKIIGGTLYEGYITTVDLHFDLRNPQNNLTKSLSLTFEDQFGDTHIVHLYPMDSNRHIRFENNILVLN